MATNAVKVGGVDIASITTAGGGRVKLQKWGGMYGSAISLELPQLVAGSWPDLASVKTPRKVWAGYLLEAPSPAVLESLIDAVAAVVETTGTVTLTRVRGLIAGTQTKTARGLYVSGLDDLGDRSSHRSLSITPTWQLLEDWA